MGFGTQILSNEHYVISNKIVVLTDSNLIIVYLSAVGFTDENLYRSEMEYSVLRFKNCYYFPMKIMRIVERIY